VHATAAALIEQLGLEPHPEGGWYVETWRDAPADGSRGVGTAIHFLLTAGEVSHWHRVDAAELWHFHLGAPLALWIAESDSAEPIEHRLGLDLDAGERPTVVVPPGHWQSARSTGDFTLVSCTVSPAFEFEHFELAPPDFEPGPS
jgi:predicted cupin superfamily sugar epimerase